MRFMVIKGIFKAFNVQISKLMAGFIISSNIRVTADNRSASETKFIQ